MLKCVDNQRSVGMVHVCVFFLFFFVFSYFSFSPSPLALVLEHPVKQASPVSAS